MNTWEVKVPNQAVKNIMLNIKKSASRIMKMQHAYALEKYKDNPLNGSYNLG